MRRQTRELLTGSGAIASRLRHYAGQNRGQVEKLLSFGMGFLCSRAVVMGGLSPFGASYLAGVKSSQLFSAYLGCVVGYLLPGSGTGVIPSLTAVSLLLGVRWMLGAQNRLVERAAIPPVLAALALLASESLTFLFGRWTLYDFFMVLALCGLGAGASLFLKRTGELWERQEGLEDLSPMDLCCVVISLGLLVISLSHFSIGSYSVGRAMTSLLIMLIAYYGKAPMGCAAGTVAGACMIFAGTPYPYLIGSYSFGGLLSGCFSLLGKAGCACSFALVSLLGALVSAGGGEALFPVCEAFTAAGILLLLPKSAGTPVSALLAPKLADDAICAKDSVAMKLAFSSSTLAEISDTLDKVAKKLEGKNTGDVSVVYGQAADQVCRHCGLRLFCWETAFHETMTALNSLSPKLRRNRKVTAEDVPEYFAGKCCRLGQLLDSVNRNYTHFVAAESARQRIKEIREVSLEQLGGMVEMLQSLSEEVGDIAAFDLKTTAQIRHLLETKGIAYRHVTVSIDRFDRMTVEILLPGEVSFNRLNLLFRVDEVCGRVFDQPILSETNDSKKLTFYEKASMSVEFGVCQLPHENMEMCGDSYDYFLDGKGRAHLILSDGMGSGGEAAVDSAVTTGLLAKLVKAGFDYDAALKIVNCALIVKSGEESLSTIDIGCVDLYTGKAEFLKAGAAPTFLKKGGKAGRIETASLPAGILTGVEFQKTSLRMNRGDWMILVSDGVTATGVEWVLSEIELFAGKLSPRELARKIGEEAKRRNGGLSDDDVTVLVAKLHQSV